MIITNCLIFFFISNFYSQVTIEGVIKDKINKNTISNANIYIENTSFGTISNIDGKFKLNIPIEYENMFLLVSSLGYNSLKIKVQDIKFFTELNLLPKVIVLKEIVLLGNKELSGNEILKKSLENFSNNYSNLPYESKVFFRHIERNKNNYKLLIESALDFYDPGFNITSSKIKFNVNEVRRSLDQREIDSLFIYRMYLIKEKGYKLNKVYKNEKIADTTSTEEFIKAIKWNDKSINSIDNLFRSKLNMIRNSHQSNALFDSDIFKKHTFVLDTTLVEDDRIIYKIKITPSKKIIDLNTSISYNGGLAPIGWIHIYKDNYAIKYIEYSLIAASRDQKLRSKLIFDTNVNHKIKIDFIELNGKMYPRYFAYETPKILNFMFKPDSNGNYQKELKRKTGDQYYYTKQEFLFTEVITGDNINTLRLDTYWDSDFFTFKTYNIDFWENYNILLESEDDKKLRLDLEKKISLKNQFKGNEKNIRK
jgi:hypothetical protein